MKTRWQQCKWRNKTAKILSHTRPYEESLRKLNLKSVQLVSLPTELHRLLNSLRPFADRWPWHWSVSPPDASDYTKQHTAKHEAGCNGPYVIFSWHLTDSVSDYNCLCDVSSGDDVTLCNRFTTAGSDQSRAIRPSNKSNKFRNGNTQHCKHYPPNPQKILVTPIGRNSRKPIQLIQLHFVQNNPTFHNECVLFRSGLSLKGSSLTVHSSGIEYISFLLHTYCLSRAHYFRVLQNVTPSFKQYLIVSPHGD